jgi:hypothetical protein
MIYDIYTKSETLLYFKALMEREKERRAFIVTYIWVFVFLYMGFYITHITLYSIYGILYNTYNSLFYIWVFKYRINTYNS